jgi:hypothetical protein
MEAGRCLLRDHSGRVEAIQVEVVAPALLRAFSTTPQAASTSPGGGDDHAPAERVAAR